MKYRIKIIEHDGGKVYIPQFKYCWFTRWSGLGWEYPMIGFFDTYYPTLESAQEAIDKEKKIDNYSKNKKTTFIPQ